MGTDGDDGENASGKKKKKKKKKKGRKLIMKRHYIVPPITVFLSTRSLYEVTNLLMLSICFNNVMGFGCKFEWMYC